MSKLEVTLVPIPVATPQGKDSGWFAQSLSDAVGSFGTIARSVAGVVIYVVVFSPLWLPVLWISWRSRRHLATKQSA